MRPLILNDAAKATINRVVEFAHTNPISRERLLYGVANPDAGAVGDDERLCVIVPVEFRCVFSIEDQPMGLSRHLSVSVPDTTRAPSPRAVAMLMAAFGFSHAFTTFVDTAQRDEPARRAPPFCLFYIERVDFTAINVVEKMQ